MPRAASDVIKITLEVPGAAPALLEQLIAMLGLAVATAEPPNAEPVIDEPAPYPIAQQHTPAVPPVQYVPQAPYPQPPVVPSTAAPAFPTSAPTYTLDDLMRAGSSLADAGQREAVVGLIAQFGVPTLAQVPPERYGEFAVALRGLGAQL
ncbi:MAG: hypothetical protein FWF12_10360 [Betaproteobacteria bacterium]|nr:hypothetical protein [Betaproteobacteria bacterium]